jgi:hypothetical protein
MHKGDHLSAYRIWKRIRGVDSGESCEEFYDMKACLELEELEIKRGRTRRFPWKTYL